MMNWKQLPKPFLGGICSMYDKYFTLLSDKKRQNMNLKKYGKTSGPMLSSYVHLIILLILKNVKGKRRSLKIMVKGAYLLVKWRSKTYRLFNPLTDKIGQGRDVIFSEKEAWRSIVKKKI